MARRGQHLRAALAELHEELGDVEARAAQIRAAISSLQQLISLEADDGSAETVDAPTLAPIWQEAAAGGSSTANGGMPQARRPLLRDGIPSVLREFPSGLTIKELADELQMRQWIGGGNERSRIEMTRSALSALRREGVVRSKTPPGGKASTWRLSNEMLTRLPTTSPSEEKLGI